MLLMDGIVDFVDVDVNVVDIGAWGVMIIVYRHYRVFFLFKL